MKLISVAWFKKYDFNKCNFNKIALYENWLQKYAEDQPYEYFLDNYHPRCDLIEYK